MFLYFLTKLSRLKSSSESVIKNILYVNQN